MKYSSRFFLYAPLGLFLALTLGVGIHWWIVASALSARLQAMNGHEMMPGVTMRYASRTISGFPFSLDTVFRDVTFEIATPHGPALWSAEGFAMHALTYGRAETIFEAGGRQTLHWTRDDGTKRTLIFDVGSLHASAIADGKAVTRFDLDIVGFGSRALTAQRLQFHIRRHTAETFDLVVAADGVRFSPADSPDLGNQIATARLDGTIKSAGAFEALRGGAQRWFDAAEAWHERGGALKIDSLSLAWSGLTMTGAGTLSLDGAHRPQGVLDFKVAGIDALRRRAGRLPPGPGLAKALLARAGNSDRADPALGFENGIVSLDGEPADTVTKLY